MATTFREKLDKLRGAGEPSVASLKFLSDLASEDRATLRDVWPTLPANRRALIVSELVLIGEDNIEYNFRHVFLTALEDASAPVRRSAIEGLEEDNSTLLMGRLLGMLRNDPDEGVREATAIALGRFTLLAQCNKLANNGTNNTERLREALMESARDRKETPGVRRRAVESLGYFCQDREVQELIADEYRQGDVHGESAVLAMGRSMDEQWTPIILHELNNERAAMRYEAAHAAGEMGLESALPQLIKLVDDRDVEVRLAAVWALGQVGGKPAKDALTRALQSSEPAMREAAQEALQELNFAANPLNIVGE